MAEPQHKRHAADARRAGDLRIERALLTVFDKRGVVDFARALAELGVEIISTGGTAAELAEHGIDVARDRGLHRASRRSSTAA